MMVVHTAFFSACGSGSPGARQPLRRSLGHFPSLQSRVCPLSRSRPPMARRTAWVSARRTRHTPTVGLIWRGTEIGLQRMVASQQLLDADGITRRSDKDDRVGRQSLRLGRVVGQPRGSTCFLGGAKAPNPKRTAPPGRCQASCGRGRSGPTRHRTCSSKPGPLRRYRPRC
jgi:hypothetical protein